MKTRTVIECVGELLGPVDFSYDFSGKHPSLYPCFRDPNERGRRIAEHIELLRRLEEKHRAGVAMEVLMSHSDVWRSVIDVGMYDGWPYWQPTPAIYCKGPIGGEWMFWDSLRAIGEAR